MDGFLERLFMAEMIIASILLLSSITPSNAECSTHTRCNDCITQGITCAWCNDIDVLLTFGMNSSDVRPAQLCGTPEELTAIGCSNIINPISTSETRNVPSNGSSSYVSLTAATVNLRPGQSSSFDVTVSPPTSSPVDMYLLLDFSLTMQQNIQSLRSLAAELVIRMRTLSNDFRIGFGSFVDKRIVPFADEDSQNFTCFGDAEVRGLTVDQCEATYAFRHVLDFTSSIEELETELNRTKLSASPDHPESVLDAMLQTALCEEELGWRPRGQSQRIMVVFTDGDYHYALDGKIGGIVDQPSTIECRLDPITHEYTTAHLFDYPSSGLISEALNERLITPIFAVPSNVRSVYNGLVGSIRSATVETLSADPSDILNLIENQYRLLSGTVIPTLTPDLERTGVSITVLPTDNCGAGSLSPNTADVCLNINNSTNVTYTIEVSATPEACQLSQPFQAQIQFIRFGTINIDISFQCECNCDELVMNSEVCSGQGFLECSTCVCNDNSIGGALCNCPLGIGQIVGCVDPQGDQGNVCNGQGVCVCGRCQCNQINEDSSLRFQGTYCVSNPLNCPQSKNIERNFVPCGGKGTCTNSRCECDDGYNGGACECKTDNSTCINPDREEGGVASELCSGVGDCVCGQCVCNNYSMNFGPYCEKCLPCRTSCSKISPCLLCHLMEGRDCLEDGLCKMELQINDTLDMMSTKGMKICSLRDGSCEVRYYIKDDIQGNEDAIQIFMDSTQSSLVTLERGSNQCVSAILIWPIFVGIILGTIVIGLLVLVLWRCFSYLGEYVEYQQWAKSVAIETDRSGDNPLFLDPTSEYSNPRYRST